MQVLYKGFERNDILKAKAGINTIFESSRCCLHVLSGGDDMQDKDIFKMIQITDCHLFSDESLMLNVNTHQTFINVVDTIKKDELGDADAIFLTGDLSQDESTESYHKLIKHLSGFNKKIYWIPGNHDNVENMDLVLSSHPAFIKTTCLETPYWDFIFLNTKKQGCDDGFLSEDELLKLKNQLELSKNKTIGIVMHHHPAALGTPMIDVYMLKNKECFWDTIAGYKVKLILCGHVHGDYCIPLGGRKVLEAAPSTCIQWVKGAVEPAFENKIGYKVYYFGKKDYAAKARIWDF